MFFSSIASFKTENISTVLNVVSSNPKRYTIIASKKDDFLSEKAITDIFSLAFNQYRRYMDEIDYFGISIHLCQEDDMIFRWGDTSEEAEIAVILKRDMIILFNDLL